MRHVHVAAYGTLIAATVVLALTVHRLITIQIETEATLDDYRNAYGIDRWTVVNNDGRTWT